MCEDLLSDGVWVECKMAKAEGERRKATNNLPTVVRAIPETAAKWL